ncbi:MAG: hypothetical protein IPM54_15855 [Polyangiaceae bacterium]|nr:hypothetical protein [Polyangiaceae bacterium]
MNSRTNGFSASWMLLSFLLACLATHAGCSCDALSRPANPRIHACIPQHASLPVAAPLVSKTTVPGAIPVSFNVSDTGDATLSLPLVSVPGRAGIEPDLNLTYSGSGVDGILGAGFSFSGASAITRCPKTMAIDSEVRAVQYDTDDALCMDGKRLVVVSQRANAIEYRTWPDTHVKVIGHQTEEGSRYFEAFLPSGHVVEYGKTKGSRPRALGAPCVRGSRMKCAMLAGMQ